MQEYRLYVFESGRLLWPIEFHAPDDESAIEIAETRWVGGRAMELWRNGHLIRSWGFPDRSSPGRK